MAEEQLDSIKSASKKIIKEGYTLAITHGNGPQVGDILLKNKIAKNTLPFPIKITMVQVTRNAPVSLVDNQHVATWSCEVTEEDVDLDKAAKIC